MSGGGLHSFTRRSVVAAGLALALPARADWVEARIAAVERHGVLRMESGLRLRLVDVLIPQIPEPFGFEAFARMKSRLVGEVASFDPEHVAPDRFGVAGGLFKLADGSRVTDMLLEEGLARLRPVSANADAFVSKEDSAREAGRGLWSLPDYAVRRPLPDSLAQDMESFQIVEGIVTDVRRKGDVTFVNFGSDWRTDVTAVVKNTALDAREVDRTTLHSTLSGAQVQFRGFVEMVNGPSVWVDHPEAFRVLN